MDKLRRAINANDSKLIKDLKFQIRAMSGFDQATVDKMLELHELKLGNNRIIFNAIKIYIYLYKSLSFVFGKLVSPIYIACRIFHNIF